jgi:hypothetical protein
MSATDDGSVTAAIERMRFLARGWGGADGKRLNMLCDQAERYRRLRLHGCHVDEYRNQYTEELDAICDALPPSDSARPQLKRNNP